MSDKVNNLQPFTFSTGLTCFVKPVPPGLLFEINRSIPKPIPPMQEVENADGTKRLEPNQDHPDHKKAEAEYKAKFAALANRVTIRRGVVLDLTDDQRAELDQLRTEMSEEGVELERDNKVAYILYIAAADSQDMQELSKAILERSQPTDPKLTSG